MAKNKIYNEILKKSQSIVKNVKKEYKLGESSKWSYYIAKAIINNKHDVEKISFENAPKPTGTHISRQLNKSVYIDLAKQLIKFTEHHKRLPNYLVWEGYKIRTRLYTYMFAKILISYEEKNKLPSEININSKSFKKPIETTNEVYNYFVKTFGKFNNTVDGALEKIQNKGYGAYYDDKLSNHETIDALAHKTKQRPNCTDSCAMMQNVIQALVDMGKYKKVDCLHVQCQSGGHVKLRITRNDGTTFIRDVACVISENNKPITCVWCTNTPKAINPKWYVENLYR